MSAAALCEVCATVPTGLEQGAASECREALGREAKAHRGRITFHINSLEELTKVQSSIDVQLIISLALSLSGGQSPVR